MQVGCLMCIHGLVYIICISQMQARTLAVSMLLVPANPPPPPCMLSFCNLLSVMGFKIILISQTLKDPTIIGSYDTIAVYADNDAVEFFKRSGFTDDVVLCSRFR